jgi:hypothetical protein
MGKFSMPEKVAIWDTKENPMMSASGIIEQTIERNAKWLGTSRGANFILEATAATT